MRTVISIFLSFAMAGCVGYTPHPPADIPDGKQTYKDEVVYYGRDYLISPGDEIEVTYHVDVKLQDTYLLAIGDQMRVEFYYYPQLDRTLDVRPDGKVTLPYKGDVLAAGLTPMEFSRRIDEAYADFLKNPQATVTLIRYGQRIREIKDSIRTAARGQSKLALVQPDGKITLPLSPPLMVAGKTIDRAERQINEAYGKIIPGMQTSASLLTVAGNVIYVFGAVNKPGFFQLKGPTSALQSIAMAGGFSPNAETASVLLITRNEENQAVARLLDHKEILSKGNLATDTLLRQADVLFVPNTRLSENAILGGFWKSMIPATLSFSYTATQAVLPAIQLK